MDPEQSMLILSAKGDVRTPHRKLRVLLICVRVHVLVSTATHHSGQLVASPDRKPRSRY